MNDYLDYMDEIYEELVEEFGHRLTACRYTMSALCATIPTITTNERRTDNDYHLYTMARLSTISRKSKG